MAWCMFIMRMLWWGCCGDGVVGIMRWEMLARFTGFLLCFLAGACIVWQSLGS